MDTPTQAGSKLDSHPLRDPQSSGGEETADEYGHGTTLAARTLDVSEPSTTVLFTDVVESTQIALQMGDDRWVELLYDHVTIVRAEVGRRDGVVVTSAGDGFVAIFPNAQAGLAAAFAIIDKSRALGLQVRAGLHSGSCRRCGSRLGGILFHVAARVVDRAAGGEVVVTRAAREALGDPSLAFAERGACQLKGLPTPWDLYALCSAGGAESSVQPRPASNPSRKAGKGWRPHLVLVSRDTEARQAG